MIACVVLCSCVIDSPSLERLPCPCDEARGWSCDTERNICIRGGVPHCGIAGAVPGSIEIEELRAAWGTGESIRWEWTTPTDPSEVVSYELVVGQSEDDVLDLVNVTRLEEDDHPELRGRLGSGTISSVSATSLTPNTPYFARLFARDIAGGLSCSNIAAGRTTEVLGGELILFDDENVVPACDCPAFDPDVDPRPEDCGSRFVESPSSFEGSAHVELGVNCQSYNDAPVAVCQEVPPDQAAASCFEFVKLKGLDAGRGAMRQSDFDRTAFVEFAIQIIDSTDSYWSEARLRPTSLEPGRSFPVSPPVSLTADGSFHLVQLPLREFRHDGEALRWEDLADGYAVFQVGGEFSNGARVLIDSVRVRW